MFYSFKHAWIVLTVFTNVFTPANVQMAMPMYMTGGSPAVYAVPAPMPIAVAIQMPEVAPTTSTTTTTTTTPASVAIAVPVPVPVPMPVQIAVPAQPPPVFCQGNPRPRSCPPCPPCVCTPSCTPAFFSYCSPCHQKCRCRNPEDAPIPMPPHPPIPVPGPAYPMPVPVAPAAPPVVVIPLPPSRPISDTLPLPPRRRKKHRLPPFLTSSSSSSDDTSASCDSSLSSDSDWYYRGGKKFKRRRTRIFRRNARIPSESSDADLVKPVMSYVSENGKVKYEFKISSKEAMELLGEGRTKNTKQPLNINANEKSVVVSLNGDGKSGRTYNKVLLRDSVKGHILKEGKNKLILKPPPHKKINNLAVSFQIT